MDRVRLGNRDIAPGGDVTWWYLVAVSALGTSNVCHGFGHRKFGIRDLHVLLGLSKYVSDQARYV